MLRYLLACAVLAPGLASAAPDAGAGPGAYEARIESATLALAWQAGAGAAGRWRVSTRIDDPGADRVSLLTRKADDEPISRHLKMRGAGIDPGVWRHPINGPGSVLLETDALDGRVRIRQHLSAAGEPFRLDLRIEIENRSADAIESARLSDLGFSLGPGLGEYPVGGLGIAGSLYSFVDAVASENGSVRRFAPGGSRDTGEQMPEAGGLEWIGLHSRYFALLAKPERSGLIGRVELQAGDPGGNHGIDSRYLPEVFVALELPDLHPGEQFIGEFLIFSGPKSRSALAAGDDNFRGLLFAGLWQWMRGLCFALLAVLEWIYLLIPNWGVTIIMLAVLVRLALYPLARRALISQQAFVEAQGKIQPEMRRIRQRYKGGEQSERILELYARHNVSPLAGLKPLLIVLIQIPIFVALFHVLGQAFELRQAPFLWIETLAEPDRLFGFGVDLPFFGAWFNLLPVLMAVTTLLTMKLSPAPAADEAGRRRQNVFLALMALGFFALFYSFPAGMVLYWTMANLLHIAQSRITGPGRSSAVR